MSFSQREEKFKIILKGLKSLGLEIKKGKKHMTATCPKTGQKTTLPRHSVVGKYITESIYKFLISNGYKSSEVKKAFKWQ